MDGKTMAIAAVVLLGGGLVAWRVFSPPPAAEMGGGTAPPERDAGSAERTAALQTTAAGLGLVRDIIGIATRREEGPGSAASKRTALGG